MSLSKYLLVGASVAVAGAAILYLAKDTDSLKFNPAVHSLEKLHEFLDELYLDYAGSYLYFYHIILNLKEKGEYDPKMLDKIKFRAEELTKHNDEILCERFAITTDFLQIWINKYKNDSKVKKYL